MDMLVIVTDAAAFPSVAPAPGGIHPLPPTEAVRRTNSHPQHDGRLGGKAAVGFCELSAQELSVTPTR